MHNATCPECGSHYFRGLDRVELESGNKAPVLDNEPRVYQCAGCNNMFTFQDGQPVAFVESRKPRPAAMVEPGTDRKVDEGGPVG